MFKSIDMYKKGFTFYLLVAAVIMLSLAGCTKCQRLAFDRIEIIPGKYILFVLNIGKQVIEVAYTLVKTIPNILEYCFN